MTAPLAEMSQVGENQLAPVAPAKGVIEQPPGSAVVLVLQGWKDSPTVQMARRMLLTAFVGAAAVLGKALVTAGGDLWKIEWEKVGHESLSAFCLSVGLAIGAVAMLHMRSVDNNPANPPQKAQG